MEPEGREVRLLNHEMGAQVATQLPTQTVVTSTDAEMATRGEMKRRVLFLSIILAVYVVVNAMVQYVFDAAAIETALEQISKVTEMRRVPSMAKLLLGAIPGLAFTIFLGLLVPLCGYLGAKQNNQGLVGCFCGCNFVHCCCSISVLICSVIVLAMLSAATPGIEAYLEKCDPEMCTKWPEHFSEEVKRQRTVDCLAAGTWPDQYHKVFDGPAYPPICPKIFLKCNGLLGVRPMDDADGPVQHGHGGFLRGRHGGQPPMFSPFETTTFYPAFLPRADLEDPDAMPEDDLAPEDDSSLGSAAVPAQASAGVPAQVEIHHRGPFFRRLQMMHPREWKKHWTLPQFEGVEDDEMTAMDDVMQMPPMPSDPLETCTPDYKGLKVLHQAGVLIPDLVPKVVMLMAVKCLLLIPVILFGCLGFLWGKDLWSKLGQGYGHLDGPNALPPRVMNAEMAPLPQGQVQVQPQYPVVQAAPAEVDQE